MGDETSNVGIDDYYKQLVGYYQCQDRQSAAALFGANYVSYTKVLATITDQAVLTFFHQLLPQLEFVRQNQVKLALMRFAIDEVNLSLLTIFFSDKSCRRWIPGEATYHSGVYQRPKDKTTLHFSYFNKPKRKPSEYAKQLYGNLNLDDLPAFQAQLVTVTELTSSLATVAMKKEIITFLINHCDVVRPVSMLTSDAIPSSLPVTVVEPLTLAVASTSVHPECEQSVSTDSDAAVLSYSESEHGLSGHPEYEQSKSTDSDDIESSDSELEHDLPTAYVSDLRSPSPMPLNWALFRQPGSCSPFRQHSPLFDERPPSPAIT